MIKLFASDLDGTLLDVDHKVNEVTKDAIKRLRKAGVSFIPASGRNYAMLMDIMQQLEIKPKCICLNGAEFYDNSGDMLVGIPVPEDKLRQVVKIIDEHDLDVDFFCEDGVFNYGDEKYFPDICLARYQSLFHDNSRTNIKKFVKDNDLIEVTICEPDIEKIIPHKIMKIEIYFSNKVQRNIIFKEIRKIENIAAVASHELNLEVTNKNATKGAMLKQVASHYGYKNDEVVVIGDGFNDASMFQNFDNSFCMGQANEDLKNLATYTAKSNIENGVAQVIDHLLKHDLEIDEEEFSS